MLRDKNEDFLGSEPHGALHSKFYRIASLGDVDENVDRNTDTDRRRNALCS